MAKNGSKRSFLDLFKVNNYNDEYEDDLFDDDDDDDDFDDYDDDESYESKPAVNSTSAGRTYASATQSVSRQPVKKQKASRPVKAVSNAGSNSNKLVSINGRSQAGSQQVFVIKPEEFDDAQMIIDHLKGGQAIVINMEGIELPTAQRIIDFIAGACYSLDGSLQAISGNIFIAAPSEIYVSGDLREELLNDASLSPELGRY
jgi:cell division inhibitor SepF